MGRNTLGGKAHKRAKKSTGNKHRKIEYADEECTFYGLIVSAQGDCRFLVHCSDQVDRTGLVRGTMYKKVFIEPGDIVLVSIRDFETIKDGAMQRCDLIVKYNQQEIEQIRENGLYYKNTKKPFSTSLDKGVPVQTQEDDGFQYGEGEEDDSKPVENEYDSDEEIVVVKQPVIKKSNVKVIDTNEKAEIFNFDDI